MRLFFNNLIQIINNLIWESKICDLGQSGLGHRHSKLAFLRLLLWQFGLVLARRATGRQVLSQADSAIHLHNLNYLLVAFAAFRKQFWLCGSVLPTILYGAGRGDEKSL